MPGVQSTPGRIRIDRAAARLEELSGPGQVFVSGSVHDQVLDKPEADFDDIGDQTVKNIGPSSGLSSAPKI